ncbi:MAG: hypothetical protein EP340_00795 [Alphaproteobacteria bacterium]|nr:MAG: hypothetical protein EP340_00795 [Alphaproteobacteria bacterium]
MIADIASWISIIEGIAVVSTLFFLAVQVRQNNITSRVATRTAAHEEGFSMMRLGLESETVRKLLAGGVSWETATPQQKVEINAYFTIVFFSNQNWYYMMEQGLFDEKDLRSFQPFQMNPIFIGTIQTQWQIFRPRFHGNYLAYMDAHIQSLTGKENQNA